jgi:asparagine synthase (glutamine-hydrolysing)
LVFNGEIYNYRELRAELSDYPYRGHSDSEVLLAAWAKWGEECLDRLLGMFAFLVWDAVEQRLTAVRDRFGVKPLYYHVAPHGRLACASEIKALHALGVPAEMDPVTWSTYFTHGWHDHSPRTFWSEIQTLPGGHLLTWQAGTVAMRPWYNLAERALGEYDARPLEIVQEEYTALLRESIALRFRADVPVGVNLSGGLDSSMLLALVRLLPGSDEAIHTFTFTCGDEAYDETPWVRQMLAGTRHPWHECRLSADDVPTLAERVAWHQDEPFGGLPTLAYARLFAAARAAGVIVLLDGQGIDEQWAGYDYYQRALLPAENVATTTVVQGTTDSPVRPHCLLPEFRELATTLSPLPAADPLRRLQYRDACLTKMPRALRFNDRISMQSSVELREPFLDHRLFELALRQPPERKIQGAVRKWLPREILRTLLPAGVVEAPKRALQTPQREWLRGPLREWASARLTNMLDSYADRWFSAAAVESTWQAFLRGESENSFYIWQWISLALLAERGSPVARTNAERPFTTAAIV